MIDFATLGLRLDNTQAIAAARQAGHEFDAMGAKGVGAARNITLASTPMEQAVLRNANALHVASGMAAGFESNAMAGAVAITHATKTVEEHSLSLGRVSRSLEMFTARSLGANDQLALTSTALAHMKFGEGEVVAGLAAVAIGVFVWDAWTEKTRLAREEQDKLTKSLEDWLDKKDEFARSVTAEQTRVAALRTDMDKIKSGGAGGFFSGMSSLPMSAWLRIAAGTALNPNVIAGGTFGSNVGAEVGDVFGGMEAGVVKGGKAISAGRKQLQEDADKKALDAAKELADAAERRYDFEKKITDERDRQVMQGLKELNAAAEKRDVDLAGIGTKNTLAASLRNQQRLFDGVDPAIAASIYAIERRSAAEQDRTDVNKFGAETVKTGIDRLGSRTKNLTVSATPVPEQLVGFDKALAEGFKDVTVAIGQTLADKLVASIVGSGNGAQFGGNLGNQVGGRLGAGMLDKNSGLLATAFFPVAGAILGTLTGGILGGLFDHKKHVDENTKALQALTASITNAPAGFRIDPYRYGASDVHSTNPYVTPGGSPGNDMFGGIVIHGDITVVASDPVQLAREVGSAARTASARGGSTGLALAGS